MSQLHAAFAEGERPLAEMPLWDRMVEVQSSLTPSPERDRLGEALDVLRDSDTGRSHAMGAWHGDWTPWNMSRRRNRLQLWDWERFETGVPLGMDRCHNAVNAVCRRDGLSIGSVMRGFDLAHFEDLDVEGHAVGAAYLATITSRYLLGATFELGHAIEERSLVMLDALCTWLGLPAGARSG